MNAPIAYTIEQVEQQTGMSPGQLRRWSAHDGFGPSIANEPRQQYGRLYSFSDVVALRLASILAGTHRVSRQRIIELGRWLSQQPRDAWSSIAVHVTDTDICYEDCERQPGTSVIESNGANVLRLDTLVAETTGDASRLRERSPDEIGQITQHRMVAHNAPVLAGTRIRTRAIWNLRQAGFDDAAILNEYPRLRQADVTAALRFEFDRQRAS